MKKNRDQKSTRDKYLRSHKVFNLCIGTIEHWKAIKPLKSNLYNFLFDFNF